MGLRVFSGAAAVPPSKSALGGSVLGILALPCPVLFCGERQLGAETDPCVGPPGVLGCPPAHTQSSAICQVF